MENCAPWSLDSGCGFARRTDFETSINHGERSFGRYLCSVCPLGGVVASGDSSVSAYSRWVSAPLPGIEWPQDGEVCSLYVSYVSFALSNSFGA